MSATVGTAPIRTDDQRMEALKKANNTRVQRAKLKATLKRMGQAAATDEVCRLLRGDVPSHLETMKVYDLLMAIPKFGRTKVARLLNQNRISQSKTAIGVSPRQRRELVLALGGKWEIPQPEPEVPEPQPDLSQVLMGVAARSEVRAANAAGVHA